MKQRHSTQYMLLVGVGLLVVLATQARATVFGDAAASPAAILHLSAERQVQAAWLHAQQAGEYQYSTTIVQTTWPLPRLENVGLSSTQQRIYLEGTADLPAEALHMKLWSDGGNVRTAQDAIEIKVENGKAMGRVSQSDWQEVDDVTGLFAPNQDLLTFLVAAKDVTQGEPESRGGVNLTRYAFDVDGPSFAEYMREQMEAELVRKGKLPADVNLDVIKQYVDMTGQGELWVNAGGFPLRQVVRLKFPPARLEQVEVEITTDFSGWNEAAAQLPAAKSPALFGLVSLPSRHVTPRALMQAGWSLGLALGLLGLVGLAILYRKSRLVYTTLILAVIFSMLLTPLLQSQQVYAFSQEQRAQQTQAEAERTAQEQARETQAQLTQKDFDPHQNPLSATLTQTTAIAPAGQPIPSLETWGLALPTRQAADATTQVAPQPALQSVTTNGQPANCGLVDTGADADSDGLTDWQECKLGTYPDNPDSDGDGLNDKIEVMELDTNPMKPDTDGDGIGDLREVQGFTGLDGKQWYLNPRDPDTNGDGVPDGVECANLRDNTSPRCEDTDGDGTPDVFDFDNDNDGVPDKVDLSPALAVGGGVTGNGPSGLVSQTLALNVDQLTAGKSVFVDFQLRPTNPNHLWYTLNVLDWLKDDREGQQRRVFDTPLGASGKLANGSMRLIPMLEIVIPAQSGFAGLPAKIASRPPLTLTNTTNVISQTEQLNAWLARWLDKAETDKYGISVRVKDTTGALVVYVPLNLVRDATGDSPVAFSARMFYRPTGTSTSLGTPQEVRVVWLLQGKNDTCDTRDMPAGVTYDAWCSNTANWETTEGVIHRYYDDWYLTGLSVREDLGVKAAILYENPAYAGRNPNYEENLWKLANGLQYTFLAGRQDVTIGEIARRFAITSTATVTAMWNIPRGATGVQTYDFTDQSGLTSIPMTHTQQLLQSVFTSGNAPLVQNPTLLFVREERYRTVSLDTPSVVQSGNGSQATQGVLAANRLTFNLPLAQAPEQTLAGVNWAPYRYKGAGVWEACPIGAYWERMDDIFNGIFGSQYAADRPQINAGRAQLAQSFYLSLFHGAGTIVEFAGQPVPAAPPREDTALTMNYRDVTALTSVVNDLAESGAREMLTNVSRDMGGNPAGLFLLGMGRNIEAKVIKINRYTGGYGVLIGSALLIAGLTAKLFLASPGSPLSTAIDITMGSVSVLLAVISVVNAIKQITNSVTVILKGGEIFIGVVVRSITQAAQMAAVIAAVVTAVVAAGLFVAQWLSSGVRFGSLAFDELLASMVSTIIVAVIMLAIGLIVPVGTVIVAFVGLIDAAISLICKATGLDKSGSTIIKDYVCTGISGSLAKLVQFMIYSNNPVVDIYRAGRMSTGNLRLALEQDGGFQDGNRLRVSLHITSTLYKNQPNSALGWLYAWQYGDSYVKQATYGYQIAPGKEWQGDLPASVWGPGINGGVATMQADPAYSYLIPFTRVGVNQKMPLYLLEKYIIPTQECFLIPLYWTPVCYLRDQGDTLPQKLEDSLVFDIFPATLDQFYALAGRGNDSYALAWDSRFPTLCDADGDGLRSKACGGNDPGDATADSDGDGLSDFYEVRNGTNPLDADADKDGLSDYWEIFNRTNPLQADTDGDGLTDKEEVDGWSFVYGFTADNHPLQTWVTSDPLVPDTDGDGILDKLEKVYGFNPRAASALDVLNISSQVQETQGSSLVPSDGYVVPGQTLYYTATIENKLRNRHALGLLEVDLPVAVQSQSLQHTRVYTLAPNQTATLDGQVTVRSDATTQAVSMTNRAGAIIADLWGEADGRSSWLHLDENPSAASFADTSRWARPGTCTGSACPAAGVEGYIGRAAQFDGVNDAISLAGADQLGLKDNSFTVAAWVKGDALGSGNQTILGTDQTGINVGLHLIVRNGKPYMGFYGNDTAGNTTLSSGQWYHLAWRYDKASGEQAIFVNGVLDAASPGHAAFQGSGQVNLGRCFNTNYFDGLIDEVEIYPRALSADEIASRFKAPVLYLKLDGNPTDASSYHQNVTCNPNYRRSGSWVSYGFFGYWVDGAIESGCPQIDASGGALGGKAVFSQADLTSEGNSKVLQMPLNNSLDLSGGHFTQAFWVYPQDGIVRYYPDNLPPYRYGIIGSNDETANAYPTVRLLSPTGEGNPGGNSPMRKLEVGFGDGSQWRSIVTGFIVTKDRWNYIVVTYEAAPNGTSGTYHIYVDGALKETWPILGKPASIQPNTPLYVGRSASPRWIKTHDDTNWNGRRMDYALDQDDLDYESQGLTRVNVAGLYNDKIASADVTNTFAWLYEHWKYLGEAHRVTGPVTDMGSFSDKASSLRLDSYSIPLHGKLDDVRIYRYTFSDDEVKDLYNTSARSLELRLDEPPASTRLRDSSGSNLVATCSGDACPDTGLPGRANQSARFDGVNDAVSLAGADQLGLKDSSFTVAAWVNGDAFGSGHNDTLLGTDQTGINVGLHLMVLNGKPYMGFWGNDTAGNTTLSNGQWYHLAWRYDKASGEQAIFVNGVLDVASPGHAAFQGSGQVNLGRCFNTNYFDGLIDHVTIDRRALSQAEIAAVMAEAPVLNLHLDEKRGATTFIDDSQLGNNAVTCWQTGCPQAGVKGQMREALSLPSESAGNVFIPDNPTLGLDIFSLSLWVKPTQIKQQGQALLGKGSHVTGRKENYVLFIKPGSMQVGFRAGAIGVGGCPDLFDLASSKSMNVNQWNHILATFDGRAARLYINGSPDTVFELPSGQWGASICKNDSPVWLGTPGNTFFWSFSGQLDEAAIYNRALTRRDAKALYEYQVSWFDTTDSHNLVVDADPPTAHLDYALPYLGRVQGQVMALTAADPTSGVALVEYRITGAGYAGAWLPATRDTAAWTFAITTTTGAYTLDVRATDQVGNVSNVSSTALSVDSIPPAVSLDSQWTQTVLPAPQGAITLTGAVADSASGVDSVRATLLDHAGVAVGGTQAAQLLPGGAVLHLPFDELAGATQFTDVSGNNFNGTCPGGAAACPAAGQAGQFGKAARFDGVDDIVSLRGAEQLGLKDSSFTVAAWVNGDAFGSGDQTILGTDQTGINVGLHLMVRNGKPYMGFYGNDTAGNTPLSNGQWYHLAWRYDKASGEQAIFVNGVLDVASPGHAAFQGSGQVKIGRCFNSKYFDGLIDDVRIYGRALSGADVQSLFQGGAWQTVHALPPEPNGTYTMQLAAGDKLGNVITTTAGTLRLDGTAPFADITTTGASTQTLSGIGASRPTITGTAGEAPYPANPVLHLHLEEPAGAERFYNGARGRIVVTCPTGACPAAGWPGQAGHAVQFDGLNDTLQADLLTQATDEVSLAAWVRWTGPNGAAQFVINNGNSGSSGYGIMLDSAGQLQIINGGVGYVQSGRQLTAGVWQHIAAVREAGTWKLYLDGNPLAVSGNPAPNLPVGKTSIGSNNAGGQNLNGAIDEVLLYDRALTTDQIYAIAHPVSSGVSKVEIGFLHAKDRLNPTGLAWTPVQLAQPGQAFSTWSYLAPEGLEGPYQVHLRTTDGLGNVRTLPNVWEGEVDTRAPRVTYTQGALFQGRRLVTCQVEDYNLVETGFNCPIAPAVWQRGYEQAPWYIAIYSGTTPKRTVITATALITLTPGNLTACDLFGNCTTATAAPLMRTLDLMQAGTSLILTPTAGSVFAIAPVTLAGYAEAPDYVQTLTVTVNGTPISTTNWPDGAITATMWITTWTPPGEGAYTLAAETLDWAGNVITSPAGHVIYIDTTPPALTLTTTQISSQNWQASGYLTLEGLVTETAQLERLEVQVELPYTSSLPLGTWQPVQIPVDGPTWRGPIYAGSAVPPSGDNLTITVRAEDVAGFTTEISRTVLADVVPPAPVTVTLAYTNSLGARTILTPGLTIYDVSTPTLLIDWTAASDRSGIARYLVGWVASPTLTAGQMASLTAYAAAGSHAQTVGEALKLYAHVVAEDNYGNQTIQTLGPIYADYAQTPDYFAMDGPAGPYRGWMDSGCSLIGVDSRASQRALALSALSEPQKFYATWDDESLRLTWTGANWDYDGDLFIYLSGPGIGTTAAYNPFTPTRPITLPMPANTLIWVQDSQTAHLMHWDEGTHSWQVMGAGLSYRFDMPYSDLVIPFTELGITDPANTVLGLLALATEENQMLFWATAPIRNTINSTRAADSLQAALRTTGSYGNPTHAYALSLGAQACPGSQVFSEANVTMRFSARPVGLEVITYDDGWFTSIGDILRFSIGDGEPAAYQIDLTNEGQALASNVTVVITASELKLDNAPIPVGDFLWRDVLNLGDIAPGENKTAIFSGTVAFNVHNTNEISGFVSVSTSLFYDHSADVGEPIRTREIDHRIDYAPPSYVEISQPRTLLGLGVNQVSGVVHDESDVPTITLQAQSPSGGLATFDCLGTTTADGHWTCDWDMEAGAANDDVFNLRARATDRLGHTSPWTRWLTLTVDTQPAAVSLDAMMESALGDGWLASGETSLSGQLADNRLASEVKVCQPGGQACYRAELGLDTETVSQTVFVYDDAPETPISIGAANACEGGNLIVRSFVVSDSFTVADVKMGFNADLAYRNTVVATLDSPSGKHVILHYPLGQPARNLDVTWDNSAWDILFGEESPHDTAAPYYENVRRPDQDINLLSGENAQGVWQLTICDHFSLAAENGFYNRSRLILSTDRLPTNTRAWWRYSLPDVDNQDGVTRTLELYGLDSVGNGSDPLSLTFRVDTVPPAIAYITHTTTLWPGQPFVISGSVSDSGGVRAMQVSGLTPKGEHVADVVALDYPFIGTGRNSATWIYTDTGSLTQPGGYTLWVEAVDDAGNRSTLGPFNVQVVAPLRFVKPVTPTEKVGLGDLVTYTLTLYNDNAISIPAVIVVDDLPEAVTPLAMAGGARYMPPPGHILVWPAFTMGASSTAEMVFTARVSNDAQYFDTSVPNTAYYYSQNLSGASNPATFDINAAISILSPQDSQVFSATNDVSVTVPVTIVTPLTLPDEGYWALAVDGSTVISRAVGYAVTATLGLGNHAISATLYTTDDLALGVDTVRVEVTTTWKRLYLPIIFRQSR